MLLAYVAGCLAPSTAMAFGGVEAICLDEITQQIQAAAAPAPAAHANGGHVHVHADGTVHYHADHKAADPRQAGNHNPAEADNGTGAPVHEHDDANCCGLFGFSAVLPHVGTPAPTTLGRDLRPLFAADCLSGCAPDRIDRPPIASSSM